MIVLKQDKGIVTFGGDNAAALEDRLILWVRRHLADSVRGVVLKPGDTLRLEYKVTNHLVLDNTQSPYVQFEDKCS